MSKIEKKLYPYEIYEDGSVKHNTSISQHSNYDDKKLQKIQDESMSRALISSTDVMSTINNLLDTVKEVSKFTEEQKTRRTEIRAATEIKIKEINAMKDVIMAYLDKTFDERSLIFKKQFDIIDIALEKGDVNMLSIGLNSINDLAKSSPFKALADINNVKKQLSQKNTTWDI